MNHVGFYLRVVFILAAIVPTLMPCQAQAVVVITDDDKNLVAPENDDFGFANVGVQTNSTTGIYLGYRWVLTATHTFPHLTHIRFGGKLYTHETGTDVQLTNPPGLGLSEYTDLTLYRITQDPWLPTVKVADGYPNLEDEVIMVGNGQNRADELTAWDVGGTYPDGDDWTWTETTPPGDEQGYYAGSGRTLRWGTNRIAGGQYNINLGNETEPIHVIAFKTLFSHFDDTDVTEDEAQATIGDSGGGIFRKDGNQWELAGIMHAVNDYPDQPSQAIAIFGLVTYCSDLYEYSAQILDTIAPLPGDANLDDVVDAIDASRLAAHWGMTEGALWGHGDFNEDGAVNEQDAAILADNWGTTSEGSATGAGHTVPEPSVLGLMAAGLIGLLARRARRGRVVDRCS